MIASPAISSDAKIRLAVLYALRYQKFSGNAVVGIVDLLQQNGIPEQDARLVYVILHYAGADERQDDLFANSNFFSRGKSALKGLKGVENVYTQHTPPLVETVEQLLKGRLRDGSYPFLDGQQQPSQNAATGTVQMMRPTEVIVFVIGGTTYEEARSIALLNERLASGQGFTGPGPQPQLGARVILGGTYIHNSKS